MCLVLTALSSSLTHHNIRWQSAKLIAYNPFAAAQCSTASAHGSSSPPGRFPAQLPQDTSTLLGATAPEPASTTRTEAVANLHAQMHCNANKVLQEQSHNYC